MIFFVLECNTYKILNDSTRNVAYSECCSTCDGSLLGFHSNLDWYGDGWYRFMAPAGTKLPERSTAAPYGYCRTAYKGYHRSVDYRGSLL